MADWRDEFLQALQERDQREKCHQSYYDNYTKLADRTATLHATQAAPPDPQPPRGRAPKGDASQVSSPGPSNLKSVDKIRQDLAEAQRSREILQSQLQSTQDQVSKLELQYQLEHKRVGALTSDKTHLVTKIKDRDEELRGKSKLLDNVHDETVSLTLQINMAEEESQKLRRENKELVDRWMARVGKDAELMNEASKFS